MERFKYILLTFALTFCISNCYACWDDNDDDWYTDDFWDVDVSYGDFDDSALWIDEVVVTADGDSWDDDWANDDWANDDWANDDQYMYDDSDEYYADDYDYDSNSGSSVGNTNHTESLNDNKENPLNLKHIPAEDEITLVWNKSSSLPFQFPKQDLLINCVPTVLEYISNYYKGTLFDGYDSQIREYIELKYFTECGKNIYNELGVMPNDMLTIIDIAGFHGSVISSMDIENTIKDNIPIIGVVSNNTGNHAIFITSICFNGDVYGVDPGNGEYKRYKLTDVKSIYKIEKK